MTKINHEEYKALKELDDELKWIARDEPGELYVYDEKPIKLEVMWSYAGSHMEWVRVHEHLFHFIQWEDEEPYNIQELISDYEYKTGTFDWATALQGVLHGESEETGMKKDIKWLRAKVEKQEIAMNKGHIYTSDILYLINQLDEPETLSQEDNINIVLDDLKEYIKEQQSLSQNVGLAHTSAGNDTHYRQYDYVLECIDEYEPSDDLKELLVPKQGLPVVPTWFDEWWKDVYKGEGNLFHNIDKFHDKLYSFGTTEMYNYINAPDNKKKLLNIIVNELDYEVEEEQKYYVLLPEIVDNWRYVSLAPNRRGVTFRYTDTLDDVHEFTEQEIKDYDERYWAFAEPVEEMEE